MRVEIISPGPGEWLIVEAARTSFERHHTQFQTLQNEKLIRYLARMGHWLPFSHPHLSIRCEAPIFVARQLVKHVVGFRWSEASRRYLDSDPQIFTPEQWRKRAPDKKQGSLDEQVEYPVVVRSLYREAVETALVAYRKLLEQGCAPEQARMVLPVSMYTTWVWTGSLLAFSNMVRTRRKDHTQEETRRMVELIADQIAPLYPLAWKVLQESEAY